MGYGAIYHPVTAAEIGAIPAAEKGAAGGVATLDGAATLTPAEAPTAAEVGAIAAAAKGAANGVASLDAAATLTPAEAPTAAEVGAIATADKGAANGVAALDANTVLTAAQRAAFRSGTLAARPAAGVADRLYYVTGDGDAAQNDRLYRDTGAAWVEILMRQAAIGLLLKRKTSDESVTSSSTLQDDNELLLPIAANQILAVEFSLVVSGGGGDFKCSINNPAGSGAKRISGIGPELAVVSAISSLASFDETGSAGPLSFGIVAGGVAIKVSYLVVNGANAGNVTLQWAQDASNATATVVRAESYAQGQVVLE